MQSSQPVTTDFDEVIMDNLISGAPVYYTKGTLNICIIVDKACSQFLDKSHPLVNEPYVAVR